MTDDVIGLLAKARGCVITFAPYTTQIFQILDVTLFGVLKRHTRYELPFREQKVTVKFVMKVSHTLKQTIADPNIWGAWHKN
jgi:hypothetical protein